jgi:hypothetical protein
LCCDLKMCTMAMHKACRLAVTECENLDWQV